MAKVGALALFIVLILAAPAHAWTNPLLMSFPDEEWADHAVGIDGAGNAFVVMRSANDGIFLNTRGADESFGRPLRINTGHGQQPEIATNAAGLSAIAWVGTDGADAFVHLRLRRPNGTFTVDTIVSPSGADATRPEVGIDDAGDAFVSWESTDGGATRSYLRVKSAAGTLGSLLAVSPATGQNTEPHLAVEPGGRAFVTWLSADTIFGRARSTTGALSGTADMSGGPVSFFDQSVSLDGTGQAIVAWADAGADSRVIARVRSVTGHLAPLAPLSTGSTDAVAENARAMPGAVAWVREATGGSRVQLRRLVDGAWQPIENATPASYRPANLVARAGGGRIVLVFTSFEPDTQRLRARERRADGSWGPISVVTADNGLGGGPPRLAVNASGQAAASWSARLTSTGFDLIWVGTNFLL
jgi:hypothetical protein